VVVGILAFAVAAPMRAEAGNNDLNLLNLCRQESPGPGVLKGQVPECTWVRRAGGGRIDRIAFAPDDPDAETRFRSLMSELAIVMAPRLVIPADTLGIAGFQVSAEIGITQINRDKAYWDGVERVSPLNRNAGRPSPWLSTVGMFVRKGIWLPLPAFEFGAGAVHLLESQLVAWQGYAKMALHEGFHAWPIPSVAARASVSHVTGTDQARITVVGLDLILSKAFGVGGTARLEPFGGWSYLFINAKSGVIDATPSCDAFATRTATSVMSLSDYCGPGQVGTNNDLVANFKFPDQDLITRQRFFGGVKLKFATVFLAGQYELVPAGRSRDEKKANGARDESGRQESISLSGGFDF
jgi:hypothetical protein